jgi:hypothetical protein
MLLFVILSYITAFYGVFQAGMQNDLVLEATQQP